MKIYRLSHNQYRIRNKKRERRGDFSPVKPIYHVEAANLAEAKRKLKNAKGLLIKYMTFEGYTNSNKCNNVIK